MVKKTLTATFSPLHLPIHTSPYLPLPICFTIWICLAIVLCTWRGTDSKLHYVSAQMDIGYSEYILLCLPIYFPYENTWDKLWLKVPWALLCAFKGSMELFLIQQVFSCNMSISPIEGALSLSLSFATALSGPSEILQGECRSHPAPDRYCTEDETPGAYTCKITELFSYSNFKKCAL